MPRHANAQQSKPHGRINIDALDGIRGLAVALVVLSHLSLTKLDVIPTPRLAGMGKAGVFLFFFLSAFLLTLPLLHASSQSLQNFAFWRYYALRRILRIWPLYLLVLGLSFITINGAAAWNASQDAFPLVVFRLPAELAYLPGGTYTMSASELLAHILLAKGKGVLWSIPVEFKYYLVLPFVGLLLVYVARKDTIAATLLITTLVAASIYVWPPAESPPSTIRLGYYLPIFLLGQLGAVIHYRMPDLSNRLRLAMDWMALCCLILIAMTIPSVYSFVRDIDQVPVMTFHRQFLFYGIVWGGFVLGTLHGTGYLSRLFSLMPLRYLGFISFSVYLWHLSVIHVVQMLPSSGPWLSGVFAAAAIVVLAALSYHWIEKPFLKIRIPR